MAAGLFVLLGVDCGWVLGVACLVACTTCLLVFGVGLVCFFGGGNFCFEWVVTCGDCLQVVCYLFDLPFRGWFCCLFGFGVWLLM